MSKIGQKAIIVPASVQVEIDQSLVKVKGANQELTFTLPKKLSISKDGETLLITRSAEDKDTKSLHGLFRSIIYNAITGLDKSWQKRMEVVGTGFNVKLQGEDLLFKVGYSHTVLFKKVPNIKYQVEGNNKIVISGADKQLVGQVAYQMKMIRKPDVYKGKGVRYEGEVIKLKAGKKAKTA